MFKWNKIEAYLPIQGKILVRMFVIASWRTVGTETDSYVPPEETIGLAIRRLLPDPILCILPSSILDSIQ